MDVDQTEDYQGYTIEIGRDEYGEDPRHTRDSLATLVHEHIRDYTIADKGHEIGRYHDQDGWAEVVADYNDSERLGIVVPVQFQDYGVGVRLLVDDAPGMPVDGTDTGFYYVSRADLLKEYGTKIVTPGVKRLALQVIKGEAAEYEAWMNGEVYWYVVKDEHGQIVDGCGGYYGTSEIEYMERCARDTIDALVAERRGKHELALVAGL